MKLAIVDIKQIVVEDRIREEMGDIKGLVSSFKESGIIQPLAVVAQEDGTYKLLAGGRRMTAAKEAGIKEIPIRIYKAGMSDIETKSIELSENLYRKDLTWQEDINLKQQIFDLQEKVHGKKISTAKNAPGVSRADVAKMIGEGASVFSQDLNLSTFMQHVPELGEQKTKSDAKKLLKKLKMDIINDKKASIITSMKSETSINKQREKLVNSFLLMDFFEGVKGVKDGTIDLVEIDPPYAIDLKDKKKLKGSIRTVTRDYNEIDVKDYTDFMQRTLNASYKALKDNGWLIVWFGPEPWFEPMFQMIQEAGFQGNRLPAIWIKGQGQTMQPDKYMPNSYEMFFYARKGRPILNRQGHNNAFDYRPINPSVKIHPTERPLEMMEEVLSTFIPPGSAVMVPFLGSGNTLLACDNLNIVGFGYEMSKQYKDKYTIRVYDQEPGRFSL